MVGDILKTIENMIMQTNIFMNTNNQSLLNAINITNNTSESNNVSLKPETNKFENSKKSPKQPPYK